MTEDVTIEKSEESIPKKEWSTPKITSLEVSKTLNGPAPTANDGIGPISA